jgi:hypothetical protein
MGQRQLRPQGPQVCVKLTGAYRRPHNPIEVAVFPRSTTPAKTKPGERPGFARAFDFQRFIQIHLEGMEPHAKAGIGY